MKLKKLLSVALITCATLSSTMVANANAKDSYLPTEYISSTKVVFSDTRVKDDYSSHYIYNTCGLALMAVSYYTNPSPDKNVTKKGGAVIPGDAERAIKNYVRETYDKGHGAGQKCKCRLYLRAYASGSSGTLHGKWSPDSVGNLIVANP